MGFGVGSQESCARCQGRAISWNERTHLTPARILAVETSQGRIAPWHLESDVEPTYLNCADAQRPVTYLRFSTSGRRLAGHQSASGTLHLLRKPQDFYETARTRLGQTCGGGVPVRKTRVRANCPTLVGDGESRL
jgi:hypothetical protein